MNGRELIREISIRTRLTQEEVRDVITSMSQVLGEELGDGKSVMITGIGKFDFTYIEARRWRNPRTGKMMELPGKLRLTFGIAPRLKKMVQGKLNGTKSQ